MSRMGMPGRSGPSEGMGQNMPVLGTVEKIDGNMIAVKNPLGTGATVEITADTIFVQQVDTHVHDIKVGETITAMGNQRGSVFYAPLVQIGGNPIGGPMGRPMGGPMPGGVAMLKAPGAAPGKPPADGGLPVPVTGTVERVDGMLMTVKAEDGTVTTVEVAADAKILKQVEAQVHDIQAGRAIVATGSRQSNVFQASRIEILSPPPMR